MCVCVCVTHAGTLVLSVFPVPLGMKRGDTELTSSLYTCYGDQHSLSYSVYQPGQETGPEYLVLQRRMKYSCMLPSSTTKLPAHLKIEFLWLPWPNRLPPLPHRKLTLKHRP